MCRDYSDPTYIATLYLPNFASKIRILVVQVIAKYQLKQFEINASAHGIYMNCIGIIRELNYE